MLELFPSVLGGAVRPVPEGACTFWSFVTSPERTCILRWTRNPRKGIDNGCRQRGEGLSPVFPSVNSVRLLLVATACELGWGLVWHST